MEIKVNEVALSIDDKISKVYAKRGNFGNFLDSLTMEEKQLLMNLTVVDGAMDWQQLGTGFEITLGDVSNGRD